MNGSPEDQYFILEHEEKSVLNFRTCTVVVVVVVLQTGRKLQFLTSLLTVLLSVHLINYIR